MAAIEAHKHVVIEPHGKNSKDAMESVLDEFYSAIKFAEIARRNSGQLVRSTQDEGLGGWSTGDEGPWNTGAWNGERKVGRSGAGAAVTGGLLFAVARGKGLL